MARKKRAKRVVRRAKRNPRKTMKVVSLATALKMVKKAKKSNPRELACGGVANPLRHFPRLKGRGRPAKTKVFEADIFLKNGGIAETKLKTTQYEAHNWARMRVLKGYKGQKVEKVVISD